MAQPWGKERSASSKCREAKPGPLLSVQGFLHKAPVALDGAVPGVLATRCSGPWLRCQLRKEARQPFPVAQQRSRRTTAPPAVLRSRRISRPTGPLGSGVHLTLLHKSRQVRTAACRCPPRACAPLAPSALLCTPARWFSAEGMCLPVLAPASRLQSAKRKRTSGPTWPMRGRGRETAEYQCVEFDSIVAVTVPPVHALKVPSC